MFAQIAAICVMATTGLQAEQKGVLEKGAAWFQSAWSTVQKQGKPAAEKAVREFPERFKALPKRVADLQKRYGKTVADLKLEEKKAVALELWRIRQGLNLMALIDSGLLEQLTGIDAKVLRSAQQQVASLSQRLAPK